MQIDKFLATVYLGDRACKSLTIDGWNERVTLVINEISRVRSATGKWDYYNDENVEDGCLVFTGVKSVSLTPPGPLPSDYIGTESIESIASHPGLFRVKFSVGGSLPLIGMIETQTIEIVAEGVHIEDPRRPGIEIKE
jgi:hypothetical protein